jgi:hypothetical protein
MFLSIFTHNATVQPEARLRAGRLQRIVGPSAQVLSRNVALEQ